MSYQIVLLDLDHTLFDTDASIEMAFDDVMAVAGQEDVSAFGVFNEINQALWRQVERQELTPPQVHIARFEQLGERLGLTAPPQEMAAAFASGMGEHGELYEGALSMLDELAQFATLGLITNGLSEIQRRRLDRLKIDHYFEVVVISAEVQIAKPAPAIFDLAFEQLGSGLRSDALMVGDSLTSDIAGGIAAGIDTCWYNPHGVAPDPERTATYTIASLNELPALVSHGR